MQAQSCGTGCRAHQVSPFRPRIGHTPLWYYLPNPVATQKNQLYYGDNYEVLKRYVKDESVDLVYLDPPFNSRQDYNVLFAEKDGSQSSSQIHAFEDTWEWNIDAQHRIALCSERFQPSCALCQLRKQL